MTAKVGDSVQVHYTGRLEDGSEFDSSTGREPLAFTLGQGNLIAGFEQAVVGMAQGETKTVTVPADQAYGARNEDMVQKVERETIPDEIDLRLGLRLQAQGPDGQAVALTVVGMDDDYVTLDANHPLAGKDLTFDIEVVAIG